MFFLGCSSFLSIDSMRCVVCQCALCLFYVLHGCWAHSALFTEYWHRSLDISWFGERLVVFILYQSIDTYHPLPYRINNKYRMLCSPTVYSVLPLLITPTRPDATKAWTIHKHSSLVSIHPNSTAEWRQIQRFPLQLVRNTPRRIFIYCVMIGIAFKRARGHFLLTVVLCRPLLLRCLNSDKGYSFWFSSRSFLCLY